MSHPLWYWPRPPDVSGLTDQQLVELARDNHEKGFRGIVRRYEREVMERIYDLVRDYDVTNDLAQETWVRAFAAIRERDPPRNLRPWLLRIAYNTTIDHLRRKRPDAVPLEQDAFEITPGNGGYRPPLARFEGRTRSREARRSARDDAIERALSALPPEQRVCVVLRYWKKQSYEEIARSEGIPVGTAKTRARRGRETLRALLDQQAESWLIDSWSYDPYYPLLPPKPDQI